MSYPEGVQVADLIATVVRTGYTAEEPPPPRLPQLQPAEDPAKKKPGFFSRIFGGKDGGTKKDDKKPNDSNQAPAKPNPPATSPP